MIEIIQNRVELAPEAKDLIQNILCDNKLDIAIDTREQLNRKLSEAIEIKPSELKSRTMEELDKEDSDPEVIDLEAPIEILDLEADGVEEKEEEKVKSTAEDLQKSEDEDNVIVALVCGIQINVENWFRLEMN